jgi:N-carbamoylputrescine amidase
VGFELEPGGPGGIQFFGSSFVAAPDGRVLAKAGSDASAVVVTTLENAAIERARIGWPFMRDRRIDAYGGITSRWNG